MVRRLEICNVCSKETYNTSGIKTSFSLRIDASECDDDDVPPCDCAPYREDENNCNAAS